MPSGNVVHHANFFQHIFGTSRTSEVINTAIVIFGLTLIIVFVVLPIARLVLDALDFRRLRSRSKVFLEITPPAVSTKTPHATAQWLGALHGLLRNSRTDRLLHRKRLLPLEVVSTRTEGIRYIAQLNPQDVAIFKQLLVSYLPTVRFREVQDYLPAFEKASEVRIMEFKQAGHFAYSLAPQDILSQHDPIAFIAGAMTKPLPDELIAFQLVLSPASSRVAAKVRSKLIHGEDAGLQRRAWHYPFIIFWKLFRFVFSIFTSLLEVIGDELSGVRGARPKSGYLPPAITPVTQHVLESVHSKLGQPLFNIDIRALVIGHDSTERMQGLANSLYQFHVPGYQGLTHRSNFPSRRRKMSYRLSSFKDRMPAMFTTNSSVFSASEVASLYHFPYGATAQTENLMKTLTKTLPAPLSMKQHADAKDFDVILGTNRYHGSDTLIGLTAADRQKHVYLTGGTGNGKTTLMEFAIVQDMRADKGIAFIDPHGDAAQKLLKYVPQSRLGDVIYLNPIDITYPIGINLLELPEGLDEDDLLIEKERVTEAVVSVLRKVFADDDANAHRIEAMLRNAIRTAFTVPDATLFTILKLLRNAEFRKGVVSKLEDEDLKDFWREEFGQAGGMQRVSMSKGLTHRIDRFQSSAPAYRMFNQVKSTISFEGIMNEGKILICNFSTEMGEDTSTLFGTTILAKLKIAAERRARVLEAERRPFYVYVDEFQNFATTPFVKMLSASRKYKLYLTIAEQSTAQQDEQRLTEAILANVSTVVCFQTGSPADERLLLPRFEPYIEKNDIGNLPAYTYYLRVRASEPMEPMSGETLLLDDDSGTVEKANDVIAASRERYAITYEALKFATEQTAKNKLSAKQPAANRDAKIKKTTDKKRGNARHAVRRTSKPKKLKVSV